MVIRIEQQEATAAGANQLSPNRAVLQCQLIPLVDLRVAHAAGATLLMLPLLVHQRAEPAPVTLPSASRERSPSPSRRGGWRAFRRRPFGALLLVGQYVPGAPRKPGEEQQQVVLQIEQRIHRQPKWLGQHPVVAVERASKSHRRRQRCTGPVSPPVRPGGRSQYGTPARRARLDGGNGAGERRALSATPW